MNIYKVNSGWASRLIISGNVIAAIKEYKKECPNGFKEPKEVDLIGEIDNWRSCRQRIKSQNK